MDRIFHLLRICYLTSPRSFTIKHPKQWRFFLFTLLWVWPLMGLTTLSLSAQRLAFKTADRAMERGLPVNFATLKDYPLYPYLVYQDLQNRLARYPVADVRSFLETYDDSPLASRLRRNWLEQLARNNRWQTFLEDYEPTGQDTLTCWYRRALLNTGQQAAALRDIETLWLQGHSLPNVCDPLFNLWKRQGGFTPERIWKRFALAMGNRERRLASYLKGLMNGDARRAAEFWLSVDSNPRVILQANRLKSGDLRLLPILIHGVYRWSQSDSVQAAAALDTLQRRYNLPRNKLMDIERRLALLVASRGHKDALKRLTALPPAAVDEQVREWRVRVSLQREDWSLALQWLDQLTAEEQSTPRWQYWRARALAATGQKKDAQGFYKEAAKQRDYYSFLAADRLELPYQLNNNPVAVSAKQLAAIEKIPAIQRARELYILGRVQEGRSEWQYAMAGFDDKALKAAALLAHDWNWHHQVILTLAQAKYWDDLALRFPLPHRQQVVANARNNAINPAWVYAVMRQESAFQKDARSPAGALGLMQIMPATGRRIARTLEVSLPSQYRLLDTDLNIRFGAHYLRYTLDKFQDNPVLATAAYNAGPGRVTQWLKEDTIPIAADIWAETIPFFETRKYVQRVMEYTVIYSHSLGSTDTASSFLSGLRQQLTSSSS
jgi:soluble lytic murein transglycosylase